MTDSKAADEEVDGPQIAANILFKMDKERRERILSMMAIKSPDSTKQVLANMSLLSRVFSYTTKQLEEGLLRVCNEDLALSIYNETDTIKNFIYQHIPLERRKKISELLTKIPTATPMYSLEAAKKITLQALETRLQIIG